MKIIRFQAENEVQAAIGLLDSYLAGERMIIEAMRKAMVERVDTSGKVGIYLEDGEVKS